MNHVLQQSVVARKHLLTKKKVWKGRTEAPGSPEKRKILLKWAREKKNERTHSLRVKRVWGANLDVWHYGCGEKWRDQESVTTQTTQSKQQY